MTGPTARVVCCCQAMIPAKYWSTSGWVLDDSCRLDALAKGTKGASKWWLPYERPSVSGDQERAWDRPSSAVTPGGRSSGAAQDSDRAYDPDEQPSARSTASRSVAAS